MTIRQKYQQLFLHQLSEGLYLCKIVQNWVPSENFSTLIGLFRLPGPGLSSIQRQFLPAALSCNGLTAFKVITEAVSSVKLRHSLLSPLFLPADSRSLSGTARYMEYKKISYPWNQQCRMPTHKSPLCPRWSLPIKKGSHYQYKMTV